MPFFRRSTTPVKVNTTTGAPTLWFTLTDRTFTVSTGGGTYKQHGLLCHFLHFFRSEPYPTTGAGGEGPMWGVQIVNGKMCISPTGHRFNGDEEVVTYGQEPEGHVYGRGKEEGEEEEEEEEKGEEGGVKSGGEVRKGNEGIIGDVEEAFV